MCCSSFCGLFDLSKSLSSYADDLGARITRRSAKMQGSVATIARYHRLPKKLRDDYAVSDTVLGSGFHGDVFEATRKGPPGKGGLARQVSESSYAVKAFKLGTIPREKRIELERECEVFLSMDHPHVARLTDVYETPAEITLVMECMRGGELFDRVTQKKRFSEKDACVAAYQMLLAINYIHSHNIVHRDIKLENWLYESPDSNHLKLIDFGFSRFWEGTDVKMCVSCGTLAYVAPEVLSKEYTSQCDMWSLGVVIFILLCGYMPFHGSDDQQIRCIKSRRINWREDKWKSVSQLAKDFVDKLLQIDPAVRLTADEALGHPWIGTRHEICGHRGISLILKGSNIVGASVSGEEIFRIAKPGSMQMRVLQEEVARALNTQTYDLEFYEKERRLGTRDVIKNFNSIMVRQTVRETEPDVPADLVRDLCRFSQESKFRRACMLAMAWSLSNEERAKLRSAFMKMDKNNQGTITLAEFKQTILSYFQLDDAEVEKCFQAVDSAHNGEIQYSEFLAAMVSSRIKIHDDLLLTAFRRFDTDNSGYIDAQNLKMVLGEDVSMEDIKEMMQEVDAQNHGKISYKKFIAYVRGINAKDPHQQVAHGAIDNILRTDSKRRRRSSLTLIRQFS